MGAAANNRPTATGKDWPMAPTTGYACYHPSQTKTSSNSMPVASQPRWFGSAAVIDRLPKQYLRIVKRELPKRIKELDELAHRDLLAIAFSSSSPHPLYGGATYSKITHVLAPTACDLQQHAPVAQRNGLVDL